MVDKENILTSENNTKENGIYFINISLYNFLYSYIYIFINQ